MVRLRARKAKEIALNGINFNSTMVRLRDQVAHLRLVQDIISIPLWCD